MTKSPPTNDPEANVLKVTVHAGEHDRYDSPVEFVTGMDQFHENTNDIVAIDDQGMTHPVQMRAEDDGKVRLTWIVPRMRKRSTYPFTVATGTGRHAPPPSYADVKNLPGNDGTAGIRFTDNGGSVDVFIGNALFTSYQYDPQWVRPFLYPVLGPGGGHVTRHFPMQPDFPGEKHDHPHHKSIYFAHGDVNGVNVWSETEGHGYARHQSFSEMTDGPVYGTLRSENVWTDKDERPILDKKVTLRFYALPNQTRMFDTTLTFQASHGDVIFGDTKEGGLLAVRVASSMDASGSGRIQLATGAVAERESWGKSAAWCHYSGLVTSKNGPVHTGIGLIDHPTNPRYPTYWHVRNYGLMTANPFGLSDFYKDKARDGSLRVPEGDSITFRYRVIIHEGDADQGAMDARFADFAYPAVVTQ